MAEFEKQFTTLYLGYSSNLSPVTMKQRCPDSLFVGIAQLKDYKWIINSTSYASIIPSVGDVVYGSLYFLSGRDEKALDTSEGAPWLYEKQYLDVHRILNGEFEGNATQALAYVDVQRLEEGTIEPDYIVWVNKAVRDGLKNGVPEEYIEKYLWKWVGQPKKEQEIMMVRAGMGSGDGPRRSGTCDGRPGSRMMVRWRVLQVRLALIHMNASSGQKVRTDRSLRIDARVKNRYSSKLYVLRAFLRLLE